MDNIRDDSTSNYKNRNKSLYLFIWKIFYKTELTRENRTQRRKYRDEIVYVAHMYVTVNADNLVMNFGTCKV